MKLWKFWKPSESGPVGGIIFGFLVSYPLEKIFHLPLLALLGVLISLAALMIYLDHNDIT